MIFDHEAAALLTRPPLRRGPPPTVVFAASILVVGCGLLPLISGAFGALAYLAAGDSPLPLGYGILGWLFEHILAVASLQVVLGTITVLCGVGIWRGSSRARRGAQVVLLVWAALWLGIGIAMATTVAGPPAPEPVTTVFLSAWRASALSGSVIWAIMYIVPVWLLARPEARVWCAHAG